MPIKPIPGIIKLSPAGFRIKFKDVFDCNKLFEHMKDWLLEHDWFAVTYAGEKDSKRPEGFETMYLEKDAPGGVRDELWVLWKLQKIAEGSTYFKYHLDIEFHFLGVKKVEIIYEGKKIKADKGEVEITVTPFIECDYNRFFQKHPFLKIFGTSLANKLLKKDLETKKLDLYREMYNFREWLKQWFKLFPSAEKPEFFHPSQAYPAWRA